ncbi:MAG: hypothetical protein RL095_196 [Verrucomicrobiota bacterium]|jgi:signal transduction histidine kinase
MRPYLLILALVLGASLALGWAGQRLWAQQEAELKGRLGEEQSTALELRWSQTRNAIREREQPLIRWLLGGGEGPCPEPGVVRSFILCDKRKRPLVFRDFRPGAEGKTAPVLLGAMKGNHGFYEASQILAGQYDQNEHPANPAALAFLQRSETVWNNANPFVHDNISPDEKTLMACSPDVQEQVAVANLRKGSSYNSNSQAQVQTLTPQPPVDEEQADIGCATWYAGAGLQFLYWVRLDKGGFAAVELDREELLRRLQQELLKTPPKDIQLSFVDHGRQRGPVPSGQLLASRDLDFPFIGFTLQSHGEPAALIAERVGLARLNLLPCILGGLLFILVTAALLSLELRRRLREARQRVSFVNQASHELRTPLTNIRLYAEMLAESPEIESPAEQARIGVISAEAERLSRLVDNLLSFSRSERGSLEIHPVSISPLPGLERCLASFRPLLERKDIAITCHWETETAFLHDPDALAQIFANLLSNVEKYVPAGAGCRIRCAFEAGDFVLRVEDDGPGVPLACREKIFEPFFRLSERVDEGASGSGLGLSIARRLAELHGGSLRVLPSGRGACFELRLPHLLERPKA